jgi:hypothetical protein
LSALHDERRAIRRRSAWRIAASLAAAVLLCLNFAMSLANHPVHPGMDHSENGDLEKTVVALRQKCPALTEPEAYRFVALARSTTALTAAPALPKSLGRLLEQEGEASWDMP